MKLIVGLGNPGKQYEKTRHNAGFLVVDTFVDQNIQRRDDLGQASKLCGTTLEAGTLNEAKKLKSSKAVPCKLGEFTYDNKYKGELFQTVIDGEKVVFLKPQTFMNLSGEAIAAVAHFYKIEPKDILVIHDEIDLPTAKIQLKLGGSSAGHNGLKSTIEKIGSKDFWRLRIGVDRPANQDDVADYVLSTFKPDEKILLAEQEAKIETLINEFLGK